MSKVKVQVLIVNECFACAKVLQRLHQVRNSLPEIHVEIFNLDEGQVIPEGLNAVIMPATYVNGQLFAYGDFEPLEFVRALQRSIGLL